MYYIWIKCFVLVTYNSILCLTHKVQCYSSKVNSSMPKSCEVQVNTPSHSHFLSKNNMVKQLILLAQRRNHSVLQKRPSNSSVSWFCLHKDEIIPYFRKDPQNPVSVVNDLTTSEWIKGKKKCMYHSKHR